MTYWIRFQNSAHTQIIFRIQWIACVCVVEGVINFQTINWNIRKERQARHHIQNINVKFSSNFTDFYRFDGIKCSSIDYLYLSIKIYASFYHIESSSNFINRSNVRCGGWCVSDCVCVCACNQWAWMIFRLKNAKMPIYLEINIHVLYAVVFGMLHIFMCQSSISRTSFKYSAEESKWRSGRSNRKIVNILCGSFLWAPNWRFFSHSLYIFD